MKIKKGFIAIAVIIVIIIWYVERKPFGPSAQQTQGVKDLYYCPMHPNFTSDKPGDCAICGMSLVKRQTPAAGEKAAAAAQKKLLYYRNPMDPKITSPVPMKDSMGMDYVPVYEE
jgi:membrane fusion protein, copper/silver efflux system